MGGLDTCQGCGVAQAPVREPLWQVPTTHPRPANFPRRRDGANEPTMCSEGFRCSRKGVVSADPGLWETCIVPGRKGGMTEREDFGAARPSRRVGDVGGKAGAGEEALFGPADKGDETGGLLGRNGTALGGRGQGFPSPCVHSLQKSHCHGPASLGASGRTPMSQQGPWALAPSSADHVVASSCIGFVMGRAATIRTRSAPLSTRNRTPRTATYAEALRTMSRSKAELPPRRRHPLARGDISFERV